jgi:hypothetical protein
MKKMCVVGLLVVMSATCAFAEVGFKNRPIINNVMMPTGYTVHKNEFIVGLGSIGYGVGENFQLGTNVLYFLFQVYNANLKISLTKSNSSAFAIGVEFFNFSLTVFDESASFTVISPTIAYTTKIGAKTNLHLAGQYSLYTSDYDIDEAEDLTSGVSGTSVALGIEQSLSNKTKFLAEGGYDIDFEGMRIGGAFLWGWKTFRLKLGVNYFKPKNWGAYTWPVIGLWWRFNA